MREVCDYEVVKIPTPVPCHAIPWVQGLAEERARAASAEDREAILIASQERLQEQLAEAQAEHQAEGIATEARLRALQGERGGC